MNPGYDSGQKGFSDAEAGVIERVLRRAGDDEVRALSRSRNLRYHVVQENPPMPREWLRVNDLNRVRAL
jgi:hypothetical protein